MKTKIRKKVYIWNVLLSVIAFKGSQPFNLKVSRCTPHDRIQHHFGVIYINTISAPICVPLKANAFLQRRPVIDAAVIVFVCKLSAHWLRSHRTAVSSITSHLAK